MNIFSVFMLLGGFAMFMFGMNIMSTELEKMSGGKLERILRKMTDNPFKSLLLGTGITAAVQSSSAVTVMLVGLVNSGMMQLSQAVGVVMGSNIGTTITAWILSSMGIKGDNLIVNFLKPANFSPLLAFAGIVLIMVCKSEKRKNIGNVLIGFALLMFGMGQMGDAVEPLGSMPEFTNVLTMFKNPLMGVVAGMAFTALIQSSSASVGVLQMLSLTGGITYGIAIPVIMGQNIGTCITSVIASVGANKNAKRVAVVHVFFNVIGTLICLPVFYLFHYFIGFKLYDNAINPVGIAIVHSIFNVFTTVILFPFAKVLEKLAKRVIRDEEQAEIYTMLDERLMLTPSVAISECSNITKKMAELSQNTFLMSLSAFGGYTDSIAEKVEANEKKIDTYEDKIGTYLVQISSKELTMADSNEVSKLLHTIGDFERIGDHAINVLRVSKELHDKKINFSSQAQADLKVISEAITEILSITVEAFCNDDENLAKKVEPLEQVVDGLVAQTKERHIERLRQGLCTIELGFNLSDLLTNFERVSDHCSNIAVCIIKIKDSRLDTHKYLQKLKASGEPQYEEDFNVYREKYSLT